jgi:integrase
VSSIETRHRKACVPRAGANATAGRRTRRMSGARETGSGSARRSRRLRPRRRGAETRHPNALRRAASSRSTTRAWTRARRRPWRRAGLEPLTLHEARHTFASLMIAAGVGAKALATYLGHASVTIIYDRYGTSCRGTKERRLRYSRRTSSERTRRRASRIYTSRIYTKEAIAIRVMGMMKSAAVNALARAALFVKMRWNLHMPSRSPG